MKDRLFAFLREHTNTGAHLFAAVSGGMDSMAMLDALIDISKTSGYVLSAVHFNHLLRGEESSRDEAFVRDFCAERNIPLCVGSGDVAAFASERGIGLEEAARLMRYAYFESLPGAEYILTAHTADDNLETVLMRLIRGAGLHGLAGIPPQRGRILRPMLGISRAEIRLYCTEHSVQYVEDSSNQTDRYLRNRIRHHVLPLLQAENPSVVLETAEMCRILDAEDRFMQEQAEQLMTGLLRNGGLCCTGLSELPRAMQLRVLALYLSEVPGISRTHLASALTLSENRNPSATLDLPGEFQLRRIYDLLKLTGPADASTLPECVSIQSGESVCFGPWRISCFGPVDIWPTDVSPSADKKTLMLEASVLKHPLTVRSRLPGDRIRLSGGTKKVSRLLIDEKIPAHLREFMPILCAGDEVAAVLPLKAAAKYQSKAGKGSIVLLVEKMEGET